MDAFDNILSYLTVGLVVIVAFFITTGFLAIVSFIGGYPLWWAPVSALLALIMHLTYAFSK